MPRNVYRLTALTILAWCSLASGATAPTTAPSGDASGGEFTYEPAGVKLSWPSGWDKEKIENFEWGIIPGGASVSDNRWISLDIPTLPMHVPGMIPIGEVEKGYIDDLKKEFGTLDVKDLTAPTIPDAKTRLVRVGWQKDGKNWEQTALLIVHADHVYILRGRSDTDHEQPTQQTFDSVKGSIVWVKKK
jgi:hypothetical protein